MFSLQRTTQPPPPSLGPAGGPAPQAATLPREHPWDVRVEMLQMLRGEGGVDRHLRHATLALISTLPEWPKGLPIHLHIDGAVASRAYGEASGHAGSVHVRQCSDGRHAALADAARDSWVDCGAHRDSLFEAVLVGLQQCDGYEHRQLTLALRRCCFASHTDAQWLRQRVAEQLEHGHPAALLGLEQATAPTSHADPVMERAPVFRKITPALFQRILEDRSSGDVDALAEAHTVNPEVLARLVDANMALTARGRHLLWRQTQQVRTVPLTPHVLRQIEDRVRSNVICDQGALENAAREFGVSYDKLCKFVSLGHGLTATGVDFLKQEWSRARTSYAINAALRANRDPASLGLARSEPPPAPSAHASTRRVTADLLLEILAGGRVGIRSQELGLLSIARQNGVSYDVLKRHIHSRTCSLTELGLRTVQRVYPDYRPDGGSSTLPPSRSNP